MTIMRPRRRYSTLAARRERARPCLASERGREPRACALRVLREWLARALQTGENARER